MNTNTTKLRVLLIDCALPIKKEGTYRQRLDSHIPPLGLLMLASYLRKSDLGSRASVQVLDAGVDFRNYEEISEFFQDYKPDFVGLRCLSIHTELLRKCAEIAKALDSRPLVVAGGPHVTSVRQKAFEDFPEVDMIAIGEGENTFYDLVSSLYYSTDPTNVPGTISKTSAGIKYAPDRELISNLDTLPVTDWSSTNFSKYENFMTGFAPVLRPCATVMTTRGCPYQCVYCHEIFGKEYRKRSVDHVIQELQHLHGLGVRDVNIIDDNFNLDNKRAISIFEEITRRNLGMRFYFGNGVRGDRLPADVLDAMVGGGTKYMVYALETSSARMQEYIKKRLNLQLFEKSIRYAINTGIMVEMFTMIGFPTETEEEMNHTIDFAMQFENLSMIYLNVVNFFPGTELFDMAIKAGIPRDVLLSQDRTNGYMGDTLNRSAVENIRIKLGWFLMQEDRITNVLSTQRKFLSEREIEVLHKLWWGPSYKVPKISTSVVL
jgi:anaerobic magnesium-protoporphyrin IX monomethyl ester cyclase